MIVVCVKWVDLRPSVDPVSGSVDHDPRRHGFSDSDRAALEVGLRLAEDRGTSVALLTVGPAEAADALAELAASGATSVGRVDAPHDVASPATGAAIASWVRAHTPAVDLVICGDYSADRGSGSVPGFVAHGLGWQQALGAIAVTPMDGQLEVVRRLDGGRRERVRLTGPAVVSVEGSVARLRRASLDGLLAARSFACDVVPAVAAAVPPVVVTRTQPVRPRARVLPAPSSDRALLRIVELTGALVERTPPRRVEAEPADAAAAIAAQLRAWGYIE